MFSRSDWYEDDIKDIVRSNNNFTELKGLTVLITGAAGLIGTVVVDALMYANRFFDADIAVVALSRNKQNIKDRFSEYLDNSLFKVLISDVSSLSFVDSCTNVDYIIHLASNTHPQLYSSRPIETIDTIIQGTKNILELAAKSSTKRVINTSSAEVYGENRGDVERFTENYLGYIDSNTLRAGYSESKRLAESLIQAYISEKRIDALSIRLGRVYGATFLESDTKSTSQFIRKAASKQDIILKSKGEQEYSHVYVADAVNAIFLLLTKGKNGEAYNVSHGEIKTFKEIVNLLAKSTGSRVVYDIPSSSVVTGGSVVQKSIMDSTKIEQLGWVAKHDLKSGMARTIQIIQGV